MNTLSYKNKALLFVGVLLLSLSFFSHVFAVGYEGIGGKPAYPDPSVPKSASIFIYTLNPGEERTDGLLVVNDTPEDKDLLIYTADSSFASGGAFACKQQSENDEMVGSWLELDESNVTLGPIKSEVVPFTITVPPGTAAGEYNGCIAIQENKPPEEQDGGIRLTTRLVIRVAVTVPGELEKRLEITDFTITPNPTGGYFTTPYLANTGNVSVDADIRITTRYIFGLKYTEINSTRTIFRGETGSWNFELSNPPLGGWYRTHLSVRHEGALGDVVLKGPTLTFFSWPTTVGWIINACITLVLIIGLLSLWLYRRRKKWVKEDWVNYTVQPGENITLLSEKFDVDWKLLVKVNKLKPPYALTPGETVKVPPNK